MPRTASCVLYGPYTRPYVRKPAIMVRLGALLVVFFLYGLSHRLYAQQTPTTASAASITGTVLDSRGVAAPGAQLTLLSDDNAVAGVATTDSAGAFTFSGLAPGTYHVTLQAAGLEPFASEPVPLAAGETRALPVVALRIATKVTSLDVTGTSQEIAQAQVQQEEKQRIVGFLPNYYTSYIWNAAPLTPKLKLNLALRTVTDPATFVLTGVTAGIEHAHKTFPGYGQELSGYAKRYGATYADNVAFRMFSSTAFPVLFHQDPRYFYRGTGSVRSRILYAALQTVVCRGDNGTVEPNYSHVLGGFAAAGFSNLYRSPQDRRLGLTLRNGLIITSGGAISNILREFLSRKLTPNVPAFANGKP